MLGYEVTVEGEYIARSSAVSSEKILKNYIITVNLPSMKNALSVIKNYILEVALKKTYPDYLSWRTHIITKVIPLDEESKRAYINADVQYMDRDALIQHIALNGLNVDSDLFPDLTALRGAIIHAKEDPSGFAKKMERYRSTLETNVAIAKANPQYFKSVNLQGKKSNEPLVSGSYTKPNLTPEALAKKTDDRVAGLAQEMVRDGELESAEEL